MMNNKVFMMLVEGFIRSWVAGVTAKRMRKWAATPTHDARVTLPLVKKDMLIWFVAEEGAGPHPAGSKRAPFVLTIQGERFNVWYVLVK